MNKLCLIIVIFLITAHKFWNLCSIKFNYKAKANFLLHEMSNCLFYFIL